MNESKASRYQRLRRRAQAVSVASGGLLLAVLVFSPASRRLADATVLVGRDWPSPIGFVSSLALFVGAAIAAWEIVAVPSMLYLGLVVDRRYARHRASAGAVVGAQLETAAVGLVGAVAVALAVMVSARVAGPWWWLMSAALLAAGRAAVVGWGPRLLALGGRARAISRPALKARLDALAKQSRVDIAGIDEWQAAPDETAAFVAGIGRSRRVFVSTEVAREWSDDEIGVVVAHELAHHAHHDLRRTLVLDVAILAVAFGLASMVLDWLGAALAIGGASDLAALPLVALVAGGAWVVSTPIRHAQSRRHERQADAFAVSLTGGADAFAAAVRRLGAMHLAEEHPSAITRWLYYRHPSVAERLASISSARR